VNEDRLFEEIDKLSVLEVEFADLTARHLK
jgi:hypothetical protein